MKTGMRFSNLFFLTTVVLVLATSGAASAALIAQWNYNDQNLTVDSGSGSQTNIQAKSFRYSPSNNLNDLNTPDYKLDIALKKNQNTGFQWNVSTLGYTNITVSFDIFAPSTPATNPSNLANSWNWSYSTDGGTNFTLGGSISITSGSWNTVNISPALVANSQDFVLQFLTSNKAGADYSYISIDWVNFRGDAIPSVPIPAAAWMLGTGLIGLVAIRRVRK
jgi:hypothetical protein